MIRHTVTTNTLESAIYRFCFNSNSHQGTHISTDTQQRNESEKKRVSDREAWREDLHSEILYYSQYNTVHPITISHPMQTQKYKNVKRDCNCGMGGSNGGGQSTG